MTAPALPLLFSREVRRIHCIGAGGMGVAPLAVYLRQLGFDVSGEDDAMTDEVRALLEREHVKIGPMRDDCELVVHSSAIAKTHPTYRAAEGRGLPLVRRGEMLAEIVRGKKLAAVCGSHGKTTTTAMLITALRRMNFDAGYVLGGLFADGSTPAHAGANEWVVAEIDESDGTIAAFSPEVTVVVNLDWDHPDQYRRLEDLERAFAELFARTRGTVLMSEACALSRKLRTAAADSEKYLTFGAQGNFGFELRAEAGARMELALSGQFAIPEATVRASGQFNAANAAAALVAAQLMGAQLTRQALADYPAVRRRQAVLHEADGITVIEDYAHHPGEIRALLTSLRRRAQASGGRLVVIFQPHRFSRTLQFKAEFATSLALADRLFLLDVYGAGESPMAGGTTADVVTELKRSASTVNVTYSGKEADVFAALSGEVRAGDLVAFVGAGDIDKKARAWLAERGAPGAASATKRWDAFIAAVQPLVGPATKLRREEPLDRKTTIRIGGAARLYAEPASVADLQTLLRAANAQQIEVFLLGRGSNLLVPDEGVDGLVISLGTDAWATFEPRADGRVWVGAGLRLKNLCGLAAKAGLSGFEFLEGIPGSVGGALRMNAGAMGGWMFDVVEELQLMRLDGQLVTLPRTTLHVQYRHCAELQNAIALGALLRPVAQADAEAVNRQIAMYRKKRQESQPREPSAGCIFKNPPGNSAGRLIDESGLKGARVGDAEVSPVHANFIVNRGNATAAEVLELVRRVRARVKEARGVALEPEVLLYGKDWKDVL